MLAFGAEISYVHAYGPKKHKPREVFAAGGELSRAQGMEFLRTLRAEGVAVRRQVPIEGLTVDFAVRSKRLVIEIDGGIHALEAVQIADAERDRGLVAARWRVLCIPAETALSYEHLMAIVRPAVGLEE